MNLNFIFRPGLLLICSLVILESCSVQDHLQPAANPYENCLLSEVRDVEIRKILPNEDIKIGDNFFKYGYSKVIDIVEIDGSQYALSSSGEDYYEYKYDAQNRLIEQTHSNQFVRGKEMYTYEYTPGKLKIKFVHEGWPSETREFTHTLNEYGFITNKDVIYDSEGYVIKDMYGFNKTISNGNTVKSESGSSISTAEFDLTKLNIPNPTPFNGKADRNLITKTTSVYGYSIPNSIGEYVYKFDNEGKVTRRIRKIYNQDNTYINIREYKYDCQ
ncbi:hypothetical protein [Larkinella sp.]|uniref:hypothetical protein n=1 Tax=Larkinella sp. TaxID=2034517 RepID=UPI003BA8D42F